LNSLSKWKKARSRGHELSVKMRLQLQSQSVSNLISQLEEARASGTLGSILDQIEYGGSTDQIVALYREFVDQPFLKSRFRAEHVRTIIREAMWPLRKPRVIFPGTLRKCQRVNRDTGELLDEWDIVQLESSGLVLRPDQALSAHYWGIKFDLDSDENNYLLEEYVLGSSVNQLVHMLRDLELVESHFRGKHYENVHILPSRGGADFEQLLIDVLNEHDCNAHHAPLREDLLQKTDLRVRVKSVHRRRGARVQVTTTIDPLLYQSKLATIDRLEEIVVLSPASIAQFVNDTGKELGPSFHDSGTALLKEQAIEIQESLFASLERRHKSPLGPMVSVPENLRTVIREFIELEAARSTDALRDREVQKGKLRRLRKWRG
jgi:hypothetical protein